MEYEQLLEWKNVCTIEKCENATADELATMGTILFDIELKKIAGYLRNPDRDHNNAPLSTANERSAICWTMLEQKLIASSHSSGKAYKDWLMDYAVEKASSPKHFSNIVFRGLSRLTQMVVRNYSAGLLVQMKKDQLAGVVSLDSTDEEGRSLIDRYSRQADHWLGTSDVSEEIPGSLQEMAENWAGSLYEKLTARQKMVLFIKCVQELNDDCGVLSLAHESIIAATKSKKSQLYAALKDVHALIQSDMRSAFPFDDAAALTKIMGMASDALYERLNTWILSEKRYEPVLVYLKEKGVNQELL